MGYKDRVFPHILPTLTHLLGVQVVPGPQGDGLQGLTLFLYSNNPNPPVGCACGDGLQGWGLSTYSTIPNPPVSCTLYRLCQVHKVIGYKGQASLPTVFY